MTRFLVALLFLAGCNKHYIPYVITQPVYENAGPPDWWADGPPLVITVRNPSKYPMIVTVECEVTMHGALTDPWMVKIPAHSEVRGLGQVENFDVHADPCAVVKWHIDREALQHSKGN